MKRALPSSFRDDKNLTIVERSCLDDPSVTYGDAPQRPGIEKMRLTDVQVEH
jgi:hypothetical protein